MSQRKSNDEIINEECAPWKTDLYSSQLKPRVLKAMDQYAEQEAIGFFEWYMSSKNDFIWHENDMITSERHGAICNNAKELYQLYKQQVK